MCTQPVHLQPESCQLRTVSKHWPQDFCVQEQLQLLILPDMLLTGAVVEAAHDWPLAFGIRQQLGILASGRQSKTGDHFRCTAVSAARLMILGSEA